MSRPSTSTTPPPRQQVRLPPARQSDFIIHYRSCDFHTHTFVLQHHSQYFRTYIDGLEPMVGEEKELLVVEGRKRRKVKAFTRASKEPNCPHPHSPLTRCVDLPPQCGREATNEEELHLFLYHLYFSSTLHLPPFLPKEAIVASLTDDTPTCLEFPSNPTVTEAVVLGYAETDDGGYPSFCPTLLSLFDYFDCQQALKQCRTVIASKVELKRNASWFWLPFAVEYGMKDIEDRCIERVGADERVDLKDDCYQDWLARLDPSTMIRVVEALSNKLKKALNSRK
jgi:hypothetical protein